MYGYLHTGKRVELHAMKYADDCVRVQGYLYCDMGHLWQQAIRGWNNGKMDGFDLNGYGAYGTGPPVHRHPYAYLDHAEIAPYRAMASQYVLTDHMFPTEFGTSFTAHQDLIAGTTSNGPSAPSQLMPMARRHGGGAASRQTSDCSARMAAYASWSPKPYFRRCQNNSLS
jgi:phospholipase C